MADRSNAAVADPTAPRGPNRLAAGLAALILAAGVAWLGDRYGWRHGVLLAIGGALGLSLYHAAFGFTAAWRALIVSGRGEGVRAQMLMLAIATVVFLPLLAGGEVFGRAVGGSVAPLGLSVVVGAFLFGIGMQLGGGCASGTLFTAGGGNPRMMVTLVFFIAGSLIGSAHVPWWTGQLNFGSVALTRSLGLGPALALLLGLFGAIA
ncbi:MAG: YeeE/YedE thiosulfate transporter family protein, partial [Alphaproteobacteria bacterium]